MKPLGCRAAILPLATPAVAQAPPSAAMWRVAAAALGTTSGPAPGTLRAGLQVVLHTPDAVGLTGNLGGLEGIKRLGPTYRFALDVDVAR